MPRRALHPRAALCFVVGFVLLVPAAVIVLSGWSGSVTGTPHEVLSPTAALVARASGPFGRPTVSSRSWTQRVRVDLAVTPGPQPVFVGLARASDLTRYFASTPVDEISEVAGSNGSSYVLARHGNGPPRALAPPAAQGIWIDQATGADARSIDWVAAGDSLEVVVMNADGTAGIDRQLAPGLFLVSARPLAIAMIFAGALALLFGALYVLVGPGSDDRARTLDVDSLSPGLSPGPGV